MAITKRFPAWPSRLVIVLLAATGCGPSRPAAPATSRPTRPAIPYTCRFTTGPITIDGRLDEPAWREASEVHRFSMPWLPAGDQPAAKPTRARMLWDRDWLYIAADMDDADLFGDVTTHDGPTWDNDVFEMFFKPSPSAPAYYEFQVNVRNTIFDCLIPRRGHVARFMKMHEFGIESAVVLRGTVDDWTDRDQGWSVELRIPWTSLAHTGGRPEPGDEWRFALCRYDYDVASESPELSTSAPLPVRSFHGHEHYEPLRFEGPAPTSDNPPPTPGDAATSLVPATVRHPTPT